MLATIASILAGTLCGLSGILMTRLELKTASFSMAHAAMAGAALGIYLGVKPEVPAFLLALLTAQFIGPLVDYLNISADLVSMSFFSTYTALAFIFTYLSPETALSAQTLSIIFWGSVLAVDFGYIVFLSLALASMIIYLLAFWPQIKSILFDRKLADVEGLKTSYYVYSIIMLTGVVIIIILRLVGGFLVFSLLYTTSAAATRIKCSLGKMMVYSGLLGAASGLTGLFSSLILDLPVGACISISSTVLLILAVILMRD